MELGCGSFVEVKWALLFLLRVIVNEYSFKYSITGPPAYFFVLRPVTLPQPVLGRIAEQVQVLVA